MHRAILIAIVTVKYPFSWIMFSPLLKEADTVVAAVQFFSRVRTLSDPRDCSTTGFFVFHHLPEFADTITSILLMRKRK